jgi:8-oxo-dGTP pyrophosphatase MutT (NUDIX family)
MSTGASAVPPPVAAPRLAVTVVVVHDDPFEVLMVRRPARGTFPFALVFPGGSVDPGETLEQAAVRETLEETAVDLSKATFTPFGHWITPEDVPRRFDTHFLLAGLDGAAEAAVNAEELDEAFWISPSEAMRLGETREELVIFPTLAHLALLEAAGDVESAVAAARARTVGVITPRMRTEEDGTVIGEIPDDSGYPITQWVNWARSARRPE